MSQALEQSNLICFLWTVLFLKFFNCQWILLSSMLLKNKIFDILILLIKKPLEHTLEQKVDRLNCS